MRWQWAWWNVLTLTQVWTLNLEDGIPEQGLWESNILIKDMQMVATKLNKTDCWICMHMPTRAQEGLVFHVVPMNITQWKNPPFERGVLQAEYENNTILAIGGQIQEKAAFCWRHMNNTNNTRSNTIIEVGHYPHCERVFDTNKEWPYAFNTTLISPLDPTNITEYECNMQVNGTRHGATTGTTLKDCNIIRVMVRQTISPNSKSVNLKRGLWMLCGRRAYRRIPAWWQGTCTLGYVVPSVTIHDSLSGARLRNRREAHPVVNSRWNSAARILVPTLGVELNYRDITILANWTEAMFNETVKALKLVNTEMYEIREVVLQNRYALDTVLASKGGACALVHSHCCTYISDYKVNITHTITEMESLVAERPFRGEGGDD